MSRMRRAPADGDDRGRIVAVLRHELLVPVPDDVAAAHLEAMLLERDFERAPDSIPEPDVRPVDPPRLRARTLVGAGVLAAALSLTSGFAAAGALPATAQHWISSATRVIGIPLPDAKPSRPAPPPRSPARQPSSPPALIVGGSGAGATPSPGNGTLHPARLGGSAAPTQESKSGGRAAPGAAAGNLPKAHGPDNGGGAGNGDGNGNGNGSKAAPKAVPQKEPKAGKKVAPKAPKKPGKKGGSAVATNPDERGNSAPAARGRSNHG